LIETEDTGQSPLFIFLKPPHLRKHLSRNSPRLTRESIESGATKEGKKRGFPHPSQDFVSLPFTKPRVDQTLSMITDQDIKALNITPSV
jgi:hypothetical protein